MIAAVALVPSPPFLLPEYAGRTDPDPVLRSACVEVVESVAAQVDRLVVICGSDPDRRHSGRSVGARVATELLPREADGVHEVPWDASVEACRSAGESLVVGEPRDLRLGLVVVADGCATRTEKAPGHLDRRSLTVDAAWTRAVGADEFRCDSPAPMQSTGDRHRELGRPMDPQALLALDPSLAEQLWFGGRAPLPVLAGALLADGRDPAPTAYRSWVGDPFGVRYVVLAAR